VSTPALDLAPAAPAAAPADGASAGSPATRLVAGRITRIASVLVSLGALAILLRRAMHLSFADPDFLNAAP